MTAPGFAAASVKEGPVPFAETGDDQLFLDLPLAESPPEEARLAADEPRVIYLFWADGGPPPSSSLCSGTPPKFDCPLGETDECIRQVQPYLDTMYQDFNVIFTRRKPTTSPYYTVIISGSPDDWCHRSAGWAPQPCADGLSGGPQTSTSYVFMCNVTDTATCAAVIAHEQAHTVGLLHTSNPTDVMYMMNSAGTNHFEDSPGTVVGGLCGRANQNSYQMMLAGLGPWPGGPKPSDDDSDGGAGDPGPGVDAGAPDQGAGGDSGGPGQDAAGREGGDGRGRTSVRGGGCMVARRDAGSATSPLPFVLVALAFRRRSRRR